MSKLTRLAVVLVIAATALMLLPGNPVFGAHPSEPLARTLVAAPLSSAASPATSNVAPATPVGPGAAAVARLQAALDRDHVPPQEQLLPSANPGVSVQGGMLHPGSVLQPEPVGIADYGIQEEHGKNVASISYTPSVEGVLTLNKMDLQYMDSLGPDEFTAQLNSVAVGVTVRQDSNYQFWTQNVIYYYQSDHTFHLASAVVNFTSSAFNFPVGTIVPGIGHGYIAPGFGYFDPYGPAIYAPEPFTLALYSSVAIVNDHPAVFFNYSVTSSAGTSVGSYDMIEFNSTIASPPTPGYQINGKAIGDTGYIPNDVELILGGDGGGSTTSAFDIAGTMNLYTEPNGTTTYKPVPAAYDFGSETGETMEGVAEWASGGADPTVHFGPGPGLQEPLWGVKGAPSFGETPITLKVTPANAFVFGSLGGSFNIDAAGWAYVPTSGTATLELPPGVYSFQVLLSEYASQTLNGVSGGTHTVTLASDPAMGMYTPLWADSNAELAAISDPGGAGTVSNPYVLFNGPTVLLDPLFGEYNDYMFPVFPGIFLAHTSDYVTITHETPFEVPFTLPGELYYSGVLPLDDELAYGFYFADHVSVVANPAIGGYFSYAIYGGASIVMWNSSHDLIAGNTFPVASVGMIMFGGTGNTLWGNVFEEVLPSAPDPGYLLNYGRAVALYLYESGDLVYNNAFATPNTAFTPAYNPYDFFSIPVLWHDRWNVVIQPATDVRVVNGWELSGNVLGLSYEGGNYWSNYGSQSDPYGVLPYDNGGNIVVDGDYVPLLAFALYEVTFHETGLTSGTAWSVTLNGITLTSTSSSISFWDPNGLYAFAVGAVTGYTAHPATGAVTVSSAAQTVSIHFSK